MEFVPLVLNVLNAVLHLSIFFFIFGLVLFVAELGDDILPIMPLALSVVLAVVGYFFPSLRTQVNPSPLLFSPYSSLSPPYSIFLQPVTSLQQGYPSILFLANATRCSTAD